MRLRYRPDATFDACEVDKLTWKKAPDDQKWTLLGAPVAEGPDRYLVSTLWLFETDQDSLIPKAVVQRMPSTKEDLCLS
jgi:hypothetical protein